MLLWQEPDILRGPCRSRSMSFIPAAGIENSLSIQDQQGFRDSPETIGDFLGRHRWALALAAAVFVGLFLPTILMLLRFCLQEDDFSHCLIVPFVSGWILFANRRKILEIPARGSLAGLAILVASLLLFAFGYLTTRSIFQRLGMVGCSIGLTAFLLGSELLRRHPFPFLFLFLSIPVPYVYYLKISLALRAFATALSAGILHGAGVPVMDEGNLLVVGTHRLGVEDACSGIRSLMAIVTIAVLFCHLFRTGLLPGLVLIAISIPVTILVNILRIFVTAWVLQGYEVDLTRGLVHESMGMILFAISLVFLYAAWLFVRWLFCLRDVRREVPVAREKVRPWTA